MQKKLVLLSIILTTLAVTSYAAQQTFQEISQKNMEMRKNIAWLTEGLNNLGHHNDKKLFLQSAQRNKILPIFEKMIEQKLVSLEMPKFDGQQSNTGQSSQHIRQQQGPPDYNDPRFQQMSKRMQEQTALGNQQIALIENNLTNDQIIYIDNMSFDAEKLGFYDFSKLFNNRETGQRPDEKQMEEFRKKMHSGQEALIKLNNEVLKMLK